MGAEKLFISWEELEQLTKKLAQEVQDSSYEPDAVVGISRGGLPISVRVSHLLDLPMGIVKADHYEGDGYETKKDEVVIEGELIDKSIQGKLLVIDDVTDTGKTLKAVCGKLKKHEEVEKIKSGVLHEKTHSIIKPDYCAYPTFVDKWIVYPFEKDSPKN